MIGFERKVGPKGQIVIPREIREALGISPKMKVTVTAEDNKIIINSSHSRLSEYLKEAIKKDGRPLKELDADKAYREEITKKWENAR